MRVHIKITKDEWLVQEVTAIIIDGLQSWSEIVAISNEASEISFRVETEGLNTSAYFIDDLVKTVSVNTGELQCIICKKKVCFISYKRP